MLTIHQLLAFCPEPTRRALGIHRTTWARWRQGTSRMPAAVALVLQAMVEGIIIQAPDAWAGWHFGRDGELRDPAGVEHTARTIEAWHWTRQALDALKAGERTPGKNPADDVRRELYRKLDAPARQSS